MEITPISFEGPLFFSYIFPQSIENYLFPATCVFEVTL